MVLLHSYVMSVANFTVKSLSDRLLHVKYKTSCFPVEFINRNIVKTDHNVTLDWNEVKFIVYATRLQINPI